MSISVIFSTSLFMQVLRMSLTASIAILIIYLARLALTKAPKVISYALWSVVLLRLLVPFSFSSGFSLIPERISSGEIVSGWSEEYVGDVWIIEDDAPYYDAAVFNGREPIVTDEGSYVVAKYDQLGEPETVGNTVMPVLAVVWYAGIAAMLGYSVVSYIRLRRTLRVSVPLRDNIFVADDVKSPFVVGFIRPRIYLPGGLGEKEQEYIILHEQHHIRRGDHIVKLLAFAALSVHWFNPLVWLAFVLFSKDMEMSCDEAVIRRMGEDIRADYSSSLLTLATGRRIFAGTPLAFGEGDTAGRIKNLSAWKKPVLWAVIVAVVGCVVLAVCLLTNPQRTSFDIRVTIPAGSESGIYYSDEEFSPRRGRVRFSVGQEVGDTEIFVLPTEVKQENAYDEGVFVTPGMSARMSIERNGWFKVGIKGENPTEHDIDVYITVSPVRVRISDEERPSLILMGERYVDTGMPLSYLPYGYKQIGELSSEQANTTDLAGCEYYGSPNADDYYTAQPYAEPAETSTSDSGRPQLIYRHWVKAADAGAVSRRLTLDDVIMLSELGSELSPKDLEPYTFIWSDPDTGVYRYIIDDMFYLEVVEGIAEDDPGSIQLILNNVSSGRVNVREGRERVKAFIDEYYKYKPFEQHIAAYDAAIAKEILRRYASDLPDDVISTAGHVQLKSTVRSGPPTVTAGADTEFVTIYAIAMYMTYQPNGRGVEEISGRCFPVKVTLELNDNELDKDNYDISKVYIPVEYWEPREGEDIGTVFPEDVAAMARDEQNYAEQLTEQCYHKALRIAERMYDEANAPTAETPQSFDYTWDTAWVNYSAEGYDAMVERAENRDIERRYGNVERLSPVVKLDSKADFDKFYRDMDVYFDFDHGYDDAIAFERLAELYTDEFFENNALFIAYLWESTDANRHEVEEVRIENGVLEIRICRIAPQSGDSLMAGWFAAVGVPKATIANCTGYDAYICAEIDPNSVFPSSPLVRSYHYDGGDIAHMAAVSLYEDGSFQFTFSPLSSYIAMGTYSIENNRLILKTDDGMFVYEFDMVDDTLVFDAEASSEQRWFSGLTDGSVLE